MFIVFFVAISLLMGGSVIWTNRGHIVVGNLGIIIGGFLFVPLLVLSIFLTYDVVKAGNIDEKIVTYQKENLLIERQLIDALSDYGAFNPNGGDEDVFFYISTHSNLKNDSFVKMKVDTYIKNEKEIQKLEDERLELPAKRWWLYFGK